MGRWRGRRNRTRGPRRLTALREQKSRILDQVGECVAHSGLERSKVSEYSKNVEEMEGFDLSLSSKEQLTQIDERVVLQQEAKKGYSGAFGQLMSERRHVTDVLKRKLLISVVS